MPEYVSRRCSCCGSAFRARVYAGHATPTTCDGCEYCSLPHPQPAQASSLGEWLPCCGQYPHSDTEDCEVRPDLEALKWRLAHYCVHGVKAIECDYACDELSDTHSDWCPCKVEVPE